MKNFYLLFCGLLFLTLCSCATIMRDSWQSVGVASNVGDVDIKVFDKGKNLVFEGKAPATLRLKPAADGRMFSPQQYTVVASKDGYKTQTEIVDWHVSAWYYAGNIVFGGLVGWLIVDPVSGRMYYLDEDAYLNMVKE